MGMVISSCILTFVAYYIGVMIEVSPDKNVPGLGVIFGLIVMGGFIMYSLKKR